jgi:AcrR family transcriptional regulator
MRCRRRSPTARWVVNYGLVARFGGDEFVVALPGVRTEDLRAVGERLRHRISHLTVDLPNSRIRATATGLTPRSAPSATRTSPRPPWTRCSWPPTRPATRRNATAATGSNWRTWSKPRPMWAELSRLTAMSGLRERKKQATRAALADAALRLCVARGVDGVTVEQVVTDAGVSVRTFFNYFSSKEEAIVEGDVATAAAFVAAFCRRPPAEPVLEALRRALLETVRPDRERAAQLRALRRTPSLLPHQIAAWSAQERGLAEAVAARVGVDQETDPYPLLLAAAVMATVRVVVEWWLDDHDHRALPDLIEVVIARLAVGFAAHG